MSKARIGVGHIIYANYLLDQRTLTASSRAGDCVVYFDVVTWTILSVQISSGLVLGLQARHVSEESFVVKISGGAGAYSIDVRTWEDSNALRALGQRENNQAEKNMES